jgi:hypothetical protein
MGEMKIIKKEDDIWFYKCRWYIHACALELVSAMFPEYHRAL